MIDFIVNFYPFLLKALAITVVAEEVLLLIQREKNHKIYLFCFVANIVTNISMNIALQYLSNYYYLALAVLEILVVFIEATVYYLINKNFLKSLRISFLCNLASFAVGLFI